MKPLHEHLQGGDGRRRWRWPAVAARAAVARSALAWRGRRWRARRWRGRRWRPWRGRMWWWAAVASTAVAREAVARAKVAAVATARTAHGTAMAAVVVGGSGERGSGGRGSGGRGSGELGEGVQAPKPNCCCYHCHHCPKPLLLLGCGRHEDCGRHEEGGVREEAEGEQRTREQACGVNGNIGKRRAVQAAHRRRRRRRRCLCAHQCLWTVVDQSTGRRDADGDVGDAAERGATRRCASCLRPTCRRFSPARLPHMAAAVKGGGAGVVLLAFR
jgi:hypothetical protein